MAKKKTEIKEEDFELDFTDDEDDEYLRPALIEEIDGVKLPEGWGHSMTAIDQVVKHRQSFNLKHGMFANVPMVCKGTECPLHEICSIPIRKRPVFQRCPIEIAAILDRYDKYCAELGVGEEDYLDQSQVKDLVDIEIKLLRTNGHLAINADFIEQVVTAVDDKGNPHTRPELHKATDYENNLLNRKRQILADLNATRKAKNHDQQASEASSFASELMRKAAMARRTIDITPDADVVDDSVKPDTVEETVGEEE